MKKLFCKHRWAMFYASTQSPIELKDNFVRCGMKVGVAVYCTKCGKQHARIGKKISKILANSYADKYEEHAKRVSYKIFEEMKDEKLKDIHE